MGELELYVAPTSFAQQRLWLLDRLQPGLATYNVPLALQVSGPLRVGVLEAALREVVDRHESLRTAFAEEEGEPVQLIAPSLAFALSQVDVSRLPSGRSAETQDQMRREAARPFDLARAPLFRGILWRQSAGEHTLLLTLHHIVTDAGSLDILVRELFALYEAGRKGLASPLPELPIQYADFATWERQWLAGETLARKIEPWRRRLAGAPESLALPTDRTREAGSTGSTALLDLAFPAALGTALRGLARELGMTVFTVVLAAWNALLFRHTGQGDLVVGTPVANRDRVETEGVVGLFLNTLALRVELGDDPSFRTLLDRVREVVSEAFAHADVPFDKLVQELRPERRADRTPLFQVLLAFQPPAVPASAAAGELAIAPVPIHAGLLKFDLVLHLMDGPAIAGAWEYATDLFDRATIGRLAAHFVVLLEDTVADPERRLSDLALLPAAERHQVLVEWSGTLPAAPEGLRLHDLFARQAARTPEALAVVSARRALTYGELQAEAGALARRLRALGVRRGSRVGICVGRSPALAVAVLAVLEAGGASVPLDPEYPRQRLELMLEDAEVEALLSEKSLLDRLPQPLPRGIPVLLLDALPAEPGATARNRGDLHDPHDLYDRPADDAGPDDLVYVLYTSGSTGRPKGVGMPHRALVNLVLWQLGAPGGRGLPPEAPTAQLAPLSFDASFQELFATWAAGGTLVLVPDEARREPAELLRLLTEWRVARIFLPFVALQQIAAAAEPPAAPPPALREVVTAGEALQITPQIRALFGRLPAAALHNQYGPTEAHVVTALTLPPGPEAWPALPAIGRPIAGARIFLLGPLAGTFSPVPAGVTGALYIGGVCLARGYHGRPELTAERFVPSPFGALLGNPGDRLYDTGDLARFRTDGTIEFLGRADQQVKIRGYRVEPAEVEAVLASHPGVAACAVAARRAAGGGLRLVAWVTLIAPSPPTATAAPKPTPKELRDFLAARLPSPLVPAALVEIARLPRTPSGKVDRAALPDPGAETGTGGTSGTGATARALTPVEEVLTGIWVAILRVPAVHPEDNFFDLGGHSLTATTVTSQARQIFQVEIPVRTLFESPTLSELALRIETLLLAREGLTLPPISPTADRTPESSATAPLSSAQRRLWFLDELSGGESPFYNIAAALALDGPLVAEKLAAAVAAIVRRHEALRTTFAADPTDRDARPVQTVHPPAPSFLLPVVDLLALPPEVSLATAHRLAQEEAARPFALARGPLLRVGLVRLAAERHLLTLTLHHIISDGWSLEVFVRELAALYGSALAGPSPGLPELQELQELPVQYADFARWQTRWLAGPVLDSQLAYWRGQLAGAPLVLALPTDRPRPPLQTYPGANLGLHLSPARTAALRALARENRVTLFMVLLAPFAALLGRWSGEEDLLVGSPIANRTHREIEGLIGCFVNLLVLRADLSGEPDWRRLLARVREMALSAYAHQDLPFERLVEELQPVRDLSRNPLFQVSFSMGSTPWHELTLPGLTLGTLPGQEAGAEVELFDLTLQIFETPHGLDARLAWNTDLFDAATVGRMGGHFQALLEALTGDPARPIAAADVLSPAERAELLGRAEDAASTPGPASVLPGIAERVRRQPAAPALLWEDGELSYEELDRRSNRLARRLRALGVGAERVVGLGLDGGADFATAVLAVWKAGGAYLPLDPRLPAERLALLVADSGAMALVIRRRLGGIGSTGWGSDLPTIHLDADRAALARESAEPLPDEPLAALAGRAAYLIYTSGSTGRPKGVVVPHGALAVHAQAFRRWLDLVPEDRVLQLAAFSFDVSVDELVPTLLAGAALVPWRPEVPEPAGLARALAEREITVANMPTALWHQAARAWAAEGAPPSPLRWVLVGGEALPPGALALWRRTPFAAVPLVNGYGPTEAVITATLYRAPETGARGEREILPIGRPFAGRSLYLLDVRGDLVPPGAVGEIHLGGEALARGYAGRSDLTAAAFVPDPWSRRPGDRLYRTGDLARLRADGDLEFLGRRDAQVKLRGFRIEPAEIEAALLAHPQVTAAAVALREKDGPESRSLVAFVVGPVSGSALRAFLAARLPAYMLPTAWVSLPALPLTAGGKPDRRALAMSEVKTPAPAPPSLPAAPTPPMSPAPPASPASAASAAAPTLDPAEALLTGIWREVLDVEDFGPDDNFFEVGGHSMLLAVVRARLQQALGIDLSMIDLFEHPTIEGLARRLRQEVGDRLPPATSPEPAATVSAPETPPTPAMDTGSYDIAIVGLGGRFPGARDVEELWRNLAGGVESISFFLPGGEAAWQRPEGKVFHVPAGGVVEDADLWDAAFFGIEDREAELIDPQHRLFLECAWEVLEAAGYDTERYPGRIGVFGGATKDDYLALLAEQGLLDEIATSQLATQGNDKDFLTTRVSNKLDLKGPSFAVQAACSTSLVALHLACRSLLAGECEMALAGGVSIGSPAGRGYYYQEGGFLSPDGHCRSLDARGQGSVDSDGVALVLLKRLAAAVADGDHVHAVLRGTGMNNDGAAMRAGSRAELLRSTLARSGTPADSLSYVEVHGNASPLGDAIEVAALTAAFRSGSERRGFCALGSIKSNLGHLQAAGGIAGLIKTTLALEHRQIPPSLHFERPNPEVDLPSTPFFVNVRLRDWEGDGGPRRAGVLTLATGGTNVAVIVEEAPPAMPAMSVPSAGGRPWQLLVLSARTETALAAATERLAEHLATHRDLKLPDVAWTLQVGRRAFEHRRAFLCRDSGDIGDIRDLGEIGGIRGIRDLGEAVAALRLGDPARVATGIARRRGWTAAEDPVEAVRQAETEADLAAALLALGRLWVAGAEIDWPALHAGERRLRTPLPTYPFERRRYWVPQGPR
jgi:amino acid adenylation domain-containing protein